MIKKGSTHSKIMDMVEESLLDLSKIKDVSVSLKKFYKLKYPEPKQFKKADIIRLRKKLNVSQAVLARVLNASESTVRKWEAGDKEPGGANCRLLQILENKGLQVLSN